MKAKNAGFILIQRGPEIMETKYHGGKRTYIQGSESLIEDTPQINLKLDENQMVRVESIGKGLFSPLKGFSLSSEVDSIINNSALQDGTPWSIPVLFPLCEEEYRNIREGDDVSLNFNNYILAIMNVNEKYTLDLEKYSRNVFGTASLEHPGVRRTLESGNHFIGGELKVVSGANKFLKYPQIDPSMTRDEFQKRGFKTITGFQTRNPPHRGHEYLHKSALKITEGLILTPVVGQKKTGDFNDKQIVNGYEAYISNYLPSERTVLHPLNYVMEYAGPREALMHAIIRKNLGCTHFIIGRDHAGVGNFYGPYDAWKYVSGIENLGITPIYMNEAFHCKSCAEITDETICPHPEKDRKRFSGTMVRSIFSEKRIPEPEIMRKEVYDAVIQSS